MMSRILFCLFHFAFFYAYAIGANKPKVFIYTDMSDKNILGNNKEHTVNDPDDISAMAAYLMLYNKFDTKGIVLCSTHRSEHITSPNQAIWAQKYFGDAYKKDRKQLQKVYGDFPKKIPFIESSIKVSGERYIPDCLYESLRSYHSIQVLKKELEKTTEPIYVLCWGSLTEPAILVKHCITTGNEKLLENLIFVSHWSNSSLHQGSIEFPDNVANCREDAKACEYLKSCALEGLIDFYECGAIGQHGVVSGGPKGIDYYKQYQVSELGKIFIEGKFVYDGVDFSDAATYIVLLGEWGVSLSDISPRGTNPTAVELRNEKILKKNSKVLHQQLLEICKQSAL